MKKIIINVRHNGHGFGAWYNHHGGRRAAFSPERDEFEKQLEKFLRRYRHFGISVEVVRWPSFYAGLAAEAGSMFASDLLQQAKKWQGAWADIDPFAPDAMEKWENTFTTVGGWPTVVE